MKIKKAWLILACIILCCLGGCTDKKQNSQSPEDSAQEQTDGADDTNEDSDIAEFTFQEEEAYE